LTNLLRSHPFYYPYMEQTITMTTYPAHTKSVKITATPKDVWKALTEPESLAQWMLGAQIESKWTLGSEITFSVRMPGFPETFEDRGTVLSIAAEKLLKYSHWSEASGLPDLPENRTLITFLLDSEDCQTTLTVRHEDFSSETAYKHANFFWNYALNDVKKLVETERCAREQIRSSSW